MFGVRGKRALVTGASSGLGRQFALTLAGEGARVALAARRMDRLEALAREIEAEGGEAVAIGLDVSDGGSVRDGIDRAAEALGGIDVLVNNAGVVIHKPLLEHDEEDWDTVTGVNLRGAYLVSLECARRMAAQGGGGSIINIASVIGHGRVAMQIPEYMAAKGGLVQLTRAMGGGARPARDPGQRDRPRLHRDRFQPRVPANRAGYAPRPRHPPAPGRATGGARRRPPPARLGRLLVHDRKRHHGGRRPRLHLGLSRTASATGHPDTVEVPRNRALNANSELRRPADPGDFAPPGLRSWKRIIRA